MKSMKYLSIIGVILAIASTVAMADVPDTITTWIANPPQVSQTTFIAYFDNADTIITEDSYNNVSNSGYDKLNDDWGKFIVQPKKINAAQGTSTYFLWVSDNTKAGKIVHANISTITAPLLKTDNITMDTNKYLAKPANVTLTKSNNSLTLNWTAITDTNPNSDIKYTIYRRTNESEEIVYVKKTTISGNSYTDASANNVNVKYYYIIVAASDDNSDETIDRMSGHTSEIEGSPLGMGSNVLDSINFKANSYTIKAKNISSIEVNGIYKNNDITTTLNITSVVTWNLDGAEIKNLEELADKLIKVGIYTLTAQLDGKTASAQITVTAGDLDSYTIVTTPNPVTAGETVTITVKDGKDENENPVSLPTDWSPKEWSNTKEGTYTVTVTANEVEETVNITVIPAAVDHITVSPEQPVLIVGESMDIIATYLDEFDNQVGEKEPKNYKAEETGPDTITFTKGEVSKTVTVKVIPVITEISIMQNGEDFENDVNLTVQGKNGSQPIDLTTYNLPYVFTGTDDGSFSVKGEIDGAYDVTATLTTSLQEFTANATIHINRASPEVTVVDKAGEPITSGTVLSKLPNLSITITDLNGVNQEVEIYIDEKAVSASEIKASDAGSQNVTTYSIAYSAAKELTVGEHSIKVIAKDVFGKKTEYEVSGLKVYAGVQVIDIPYNYPNPFKPASGQSTIIKYILGDNADIKLMIFDITGRMIFSQLCPSNTEGGKETVNRVTWNGKDALGNTVCNGVYHFLLVNEGSVIGRGQMAVLD